MPRFPNTLQAWQSDAFSRVLKEEIKGMDARTFPLQKGCTRGGVVDDTDDITATVIKGIDEERSIVADVGIFFTETLVACSCGEEPESVNSYCQLRIRIDKATAEAQIDVIWD